MSDSDDQSNREMEVFAKAIEMSAADRAGYLDEECFGDPGLREQVDSLVGAHDQAGDAGFLEHPTGSGGGLSGQSSVGDPDDFLGSEIGSYRLIKHLGEGGFGSVYLAEQSEPINRMVAIKVIKLGMDTKQVIARFEAERQTLSMMEHSGIARVYEAGATSTGRPYFVMELVEGEAITKFCDTHRYTIHQRLELLRKVCSAVQHAHQKGVIHRDIKPNNVLVTLQDGVAVSKVIDFGVAKATMDSDSSLTMMTESHQMIGTPAYMSPEQASMTETDVDTRSDVYSLGVLLYELLTGATPLDSTTLTRSGFNEIQRMIREVNPPKPSTRLSSADTTVEISKHRRTEPRKLHQEIQGDLDWIVMKAIEKDRNRRYETVNAFADDIGRYVEKKPVVARPPTSGYKFRRFVQRNRGAVVAGGALLGVLLLGIAGTTWGMIWALDEREKARLAAQDELAAQIEAVSAAEKAESEAERATREAQTAEELSRFFVMDVLSAADPARTRSKDLTVREALVNASENIEGRFEDRPDFESKIHNALGYLFNRLDVVDRAEYHHRQEWALTKQQHGEISFENARIMHSVVGDLAMQERDAEAIELTQRQLEIIDQLDSPEAEQLRLRVIGNLGALLMRTERIEEAAPILEEILETKRAVFGDQHPTTLSSVDALATVMRRPGETERSLALAQESYYGQAEVLGRGDPRTLNSLVSLSFTHSELNQHEEAQALLRAGIAEANERLGGDHATTLQLKGAIARSLFVARDIEGAEEAVHALMPSLESSDPEMLQQQSRSALSILASCYRERGEYLEALSLADRILDSARKVYPSNDVRLADFLTLRAGVLRDLYRYDDAEPVLLEAWACVDGEGITESQFEPVARFGVEFYQDWNDLEPDSGYLEVALLWQARLENRITE